MGTVKDNLETINKKIKVAAWKVNRDPQEIKLVAVTKTATLEQIKEAINGGVKIIRRNKNNKSKRNRKSRKKITLYKK